MLGSEDEGRLNLRKRVGGRWYGKFGGSEVLEREEKEGVTNGDGVLGSQVRNRKR
jgi:hypothetical protein